MDKRNILVTGIGGNVGQGIARNIRADFPEIRIVGCNILPFSAGNHLCDTFYMVPYAYENSYIDEINKIILKENIQLIIPSTDYEVYYLSKYCDKVKAVVAASLEDSAGIYLDKYETYKHHLKHDIAFAKAYLPSVYNGAFKNFIAKPKKGRGSRGIYINHPQPGSFADEEYMIQELHEGSEITTAFYVNKQNELHGHITLLRDLENGTTSQCKVVKEYDAQLLPIITAMIKHGNIKGSANIQSIVTDNAIVPFEVNCRISGTNSIRSNFGFKDVKYTVQEYLYDRVPDKPHIIEGVATRILMDVIYPDVKDYEQCISNSNNYLF